MDRTIMRQGTAAGSRLTIAAKFIGEDIFITVEGGERPHIGCIVQAVPRPSLTGNGETSATASVLNLTGHKDEFLCRRIAERICAGTGRIVVCTGGFHVDNIREDQIREVLACADMLTEELNILLKG